MLDFNSLNNTISAWIRKSEYLNIVLQQKLFANILADRFVINRERLDLKSHTYNPIFIFLIILIQRKTLIYKLDNTGKPHNTYRNREFNFSRFVEFDSKNRFRRKPCNTKNLNTDNSD